MIELFPVGSEDLLKNFVALIAGVIINWLIVCRQEKVSLLAYWTEERFGSFSTLIGALITFVAVVYLEPSLGPATYFTIGIACDSVLNKLPLPDKVKENLRLAEEKIHAQENILNRIASGDDDVIDRLRAKGSCSTHV